VVCVAIFKLAWFIFGGLIPVDVVLCGTDGRTAKESDDRPAAGKSRIHND
jgi:hypothetical protein